MRILLTGATGFLGNNIARSLVEQGHSIVVTLRHSSNRRTLDGIPHESVNLDFEAPGDLSIAFENVDAVIHSAALIQIGWSKLALSRKINVEATARIAEMARRRNIRMVHISTIDALGMTTESEFGTETHLNPPKPGCSYVVSKREAETAVILEVANGLDAVIVNPGFMIGPYDWRPSSGEVMLTLKKQFMPFAPAGGCCVADVRDVADGVISALEHGNTGERYILGGINMSYFDLFQQMAAVMQCRSPKLKLPNWLASVVGKSGDLVGKIRGKEPSINSAATEMGQLFHYCDSEKAKQELGYRIGSVQDGLQDAWDWFRLKGYV
ncbi:MAG: NAD-dependent epimerase/dehydratase family protein [Pirellulales bacterium]|jgi:dihydroflavonol-4-reductase